MTEETVYWECHGTVVDFDFDFENIEIETEDGIIKAHYTYCKGFVPSFGDKVSLKEVGENRDWVVERITEKQEVD